MDVQRYRQAERALWADVGNAAALPDAEFEVVPGGGHLPWLDDLVHAAEVTRRFLRDGRREVAG